MVEPLPAFDAPDARRSRNMAAIRSRDTKPELYVRRMLHAAGFRFRLHRKDLPGNPDIVLPRYRTAVQVFGCYWHGHGCKRAHTSKSNTAYWSAKIARNMERDHRNLDALTGMGWATVVIWECSATAQTAELIETLRSTQMTHSTHQEGRLNVRLT